MPERALPEAVRGVLDGLRERLTDARLVAVTLSGARDEGGGAFSLSEATPFLPGASAGEAGDPHDRLADVEGFGDLVVRLNDALPAVVGADCTAVEVHVPSARTEPAEIWTYDAPAGMHGADEVLSEAWRLPLDTRRREVEMAEARDVLEQLRDRGVKRIRVGVAGRHDGREIDVFACAPADALQGVETQQRDAWGTTLAVGAERFVRGNDHDRWEAGDGGRFEALFDFQSGTFDGRLSRCREKLREISSGTSPLRPETTLSTASVGLLARLRGAGVQGLRMELTETGEMASMDGWEADPPGGHLRYVGPGRVSDEAFQRQVEGFAREVHATVAAPVVLGEGGRDDTAKLTLEVDFKTETVSYRKAAPVPDSFIAKRRNACLADALYSAHALSTQRVGDILRYARGMDVRRMSAVFKAGENSVGKPISQRFWLAEGGEPVGEVEGGLLCAGMRDLGAMTLEVAGHEHWADGAATNGASVLVEVGVPQRGGGDAPMVHVALSRAPERPSPTCVVRIGAAAPVASRERSLAR